MASKWLELALPWQTALAEAWEAYQCGSLPIGAVVAARDVYGGASDVIGKTEYYTRKPVKVIPLPFTRGLRR